MQEHSISTLSMSLTLCFICFLDFRCYWKSPEIQWNLVKTWLAKCFSNCNYWILSYKVMRARRIFISVLWTPGQVRHILFVLPYVLTCLANRSNDNLMDLKTSDIFYWNLTKPIKTYIIIHTWTWGFVPRAYKTAFETSSGFKDGYAAIDSDISFS